MSAAAVPLDGTDAGDAGAPATSRIALVTGGTGGIGTEVCKQLAAAGNRVVATCLPAERALAEAWQAERKSEGYDIALVECDVTSFESCAEMAKRVREEVGPVQILVNCAGITADRTLGRMEEFQWHAVLDTNLDSVFNVTRNLIDEMIERGYGRIINISSVNGQKGQFGQTNYSAAKAGMHGFTKALAQELAGHGITVNTVSPGYVDTRLVQAIPAEIRAGIISKIPVGRLARPHEIARAVTFLAAEESAYITGSNIPVNGGLFMV
jgi:acetoacetyl-CoA reductase